jgi:tetratricopeptide (TPR) repeat protein
MPPHIVRPIEKAVRCPRASISRIGVTLACLSIATPMAVADRSAASASSVDYAQTLTEGKSLLAQKHFSEALAQFNSYAHRFPGDASGYFWLGSVCDQAGDLDKAIHWYGKSLAIAKSQAMDSQELRINLGNTFTKVNLFEQAVFNYRRALEINDKNALAHLNLSKVLLLMGQYPEALEEITKCDELGLKDPCLPLIRALALKNLNRTDEAKKEASLYLESAGNASDELKEVAASLL